MGIVQVPDYNYKYLWSSNKYLGNAGVKEIMPVRRYQKINQYLHANGSWRENPQDKVFKVRCLLDSVSVKMNNAIYLRCCHNASKL
jgi:hypothetical protein